MRDSWERWKRVARHLGDFQARLLLTLVYFVIVAPFALAIRWAADPLAMKSATRRGWHLRTAAAGDRLLRARRQS